MWSHSTSRALLTAWRPPHLAQASSVPPGMDWRFGPVEWVTCWQLLHRTLMAMTLSIFHW